MKIGLAAYRCENKNIEVNISRIERAMRKVQGKADLLCFGEAFLQGFDSLCWDYEIDKDMAVSKDSETMERLRKMTVTYGVAVLFGYIERDGERLRHSFPSIPRACLLSRWSRLWKKE